jgi:hypothetical protein
MRRKRLLISIGLIVAFLALVLVGLGFMVRRVPSFYAQGEMPPGEARSKLSQQTYAKWVKMAHDLKNREPAWELAFTEDQLNAYFQQDYFQHGGDDNLPDGFSAPRVKIDDGKLHLGVRYGSGATSTILSLELRLWLVPTTVNVVAMEIVSLQAGSMPLSTGTLIDYISVAARREKIDITWFRHDGHPVAIMRFQSDLTRPTFQFDRVDLKDGTLTIAGRSTDPLTAAVPQPRPTDQDEP